MRHVQYVPVLKLSCVRCHPRPSRAATPYTDLQAVPPEAATLLPSHWPFARPAVAVATNGISGGGGGGTSGNNDFVNDYHDSSSHRAPFNAADLKGYPAAPTGELASYPVASADDLACSSYPAASSMEHFGSNNAAAASNATSATAFASATSTSGEGGFNPSSNTAAITSTTTTTTGCVNLDPSNQDAKASEESDGVLVQVQQESKMGPGPRRPLYIPSFSTFDSGSRHSSSSSGSSDGGSSDGGSSTGDGVGVVIGGDRVVDEAVEEGRKPAATATAAATTYEQQQTEGGRGL